jgi:hypothetical protein
LVQGRERQRSLDLEPPCLQYQRVTCVCDERFDQGRLAHPRFTVHHQAGRGSVPGLREKGGQVRGFDVAAN